MPNKAVERYVHPPPIYACLPCPSSFPAACGRPSPLTLEHDDQTMKRSAIVVLAITMTGCGVKTSSKSYPIPGGHAIVVTQTMSPGLTDPSIKRTLSVQWAAGRKEQLPATYSPIEGAPLDVQEILGGVYLSAGRALFYRPGTIVSPVGSWSLWEITPSIELNAYLRQYSADHGDTGVTLTAFADTKRIGPFEVDPSVTVTNEEIRYDGTRYFISPNRNRGWWLPHLITSIDTGTLDIVMRSSESITAMPSVLVFSSTNAPGIAGAFNETETKRLLQQEAGPYGSPAAGSPSGQP